MKEIIQAAMQFLFIPYIYGGKNVFTGLDCSGLVCEILKMTPVAPWDFERNAQGIHDYFLDHSFKEKKGPGALAFYGTDCQNITHVGFMVNDSTIMEAGHGNSQILNKEEAVAIEANVRLRPINYRADLVCVLCPKYEENGLLP